MCWVQNNITWAQIEVEYCNMILLFTSNITCDFICKHILRCMYNILQNILIEKFYNLLFTDEQIEPNHKTI